MARSNIGLGFKRYSLKPDVVDQVFLLTGFDRGFGFILRFGAQWIRSIEILGEGGASALRIDRHDFRDGYKLPVPGGFKSLRVTMKSGLTLNAARIQLDVYLVPGMIEVATDPYAGYAMRRNFPSALHADPGGSSVVALAALGAADDVVLVCEVTRDLYQGEDTAGYFPSGGAPFFPSRFQGDDGAVWPSANLYFDGWISASVASVNWRVWIMAARPSASGVWEWVVYRELTPAVPAAAVPPEITQSAGLSIVRLENGTIPMAIPPDGFQVWVENTDAVAKSLRGVIGGRTA